MNYTVSLVFALIVTSIVLSRGSVYLRLAFPELRLLRSGAVEDGAYAMIGRAFRRRYLLLLWLSLFLPSFALVLLFRHLVVERSVFVGTTIALAVIPIWIGWPALILCRDETLRRRARMLMIGAGVPVCVECGHDLRGQTEPTCPACGKPFDVKTLQGGPPGGEQPP
jgi:hypothetical protein